MSRYTVIVRNVQVVGKLWMGGNAAMEYTMSVEDLDGMRPDVTREKVEQWLTTKTGDFQSVTDFHADLDDVDIPWGTEEGEMIFNDCMYPEE